MELISSNYVRKSNPIGCLNKDDVLFDLFFELSSEFLCYIGFDGYFKWISPSVSKNLGYKEDELYERPISSFIFREDDDTDSNLYDGFEKHKPLLNFENRFITKGGEIIWLSWNVVPLKNEELVFAVAKNITHKKKIESERNFQLAKLTEINNNLKQLTFTTAHNLRSPVSNLISVFNILDESKILDDEARELYSMLKMAAGDLQSTVNNYVDALSQKEILNVKIEEIDLYECLSGVMKSLKSLIKSSKTVFIVDFKSVGKIKFNKAYLESVFLNLITNSIKYAKPTKCPKISICTRQENGFVKMIFKDEGIGFDMEKVEDKVFGFNQKFQDNSDSKGIGLYLVYNHLVSLGSKIVLESKLNEGAQFTITFKRFN